MTQQDKRPSEYNYTKLSEGHKEWYHRLEAEDCASKNSGFSGTTCFSQNGRQTEEDHVLSSAAKPESRQDSGVRIDLNGERNPSEPTQLIQKNQAHSISPLQQITGKRKEKRWPSRRQRSMARKRKGRSQNLDDSSNLITPVKSGFRSNAS